VSLLDILLVLARHKTLIVQSVLVFTVMGMTLALTSDNEYNSSAEVIRESQDNQSSLGGLSGGLGALRGLGINLGGAVSGLTPSAFPDVLQSREVRLAVVRDTFSFPDADRPMTYAEYVNRPSTGLGFLINRTKEFVKGAIKPVIPLTEEDGATEGDEEESEMTEAEHRAINRIQEVVSTNVDSKSGLMTVSATAQSPSLAAEMARSFVKHLTTRVRAIRTQKIREQLRFVEMRFQEAQSELDRAEENLAAFLERNQNPTTASLRFRRDKLQRQVNFKEQLYSNLQNQVTQTRIELQRQQPVVTVVERPVAPLQKSAPNRPLIVLVSLAVGIILGTVGSFLAEMFQDRERTPEEKAEIQQIRDAFVPSYVDSLWNKDRPAHAGKENSSESDSAVTK
jgi:uncharacterized protein involved in exopolysaccharide biosynthesis